MFLKLFSTPAASAADIMRSATIKTIARMARGNVYLKSGRVLFDDDIEKLRSATKHMNADEYLKLIAQGKK